MPVFFTACVKLTFIPKMTPVASVRMAGLWFLQLEWILVPLSILVACVNIQCALDHETHFCIKCTEFSLIWTHSLSEFFSNQSLWPNKRQRKIQIARYKAEKGIWNHGFFVQRHFPTPAPSFWLWNAKGIWLTAPHKLSNCSSFPKFGLK